MVLLNEIASSAGVGIVVGAAGGVTAIALGLSAEYCVLRCCWKDEGRSCEWKAQEGCKVGTCAGGCIGGGIMCFTPLCGLTTCQGSAVTGGTTTALMSRFYYKMATGSKREPEIDMQETNGEEEKINPQPCEKS